MEWISKNNHDFNFFLVLQNVSSIAQIDYSVVKRPKFTSRFMDLPLKVSGNSSLVSWQTSPKPDVSYATNFRTYNLMCVAGWYSREDRVEMCHRDPKPLPLPCYTQEILIILSPWFVSYYKSNRAIFQINIMELDFFRKDNGTTNEDRSSSGFN